MNPPVKPQHIVVEGLTSTTYWGIPGSMWWTKKGKRAPKAYAETLEERMEVLEAAHRTLKAEWLDIYDKLYRLAGRLDASRRWAGEKAPPAAVEPLEKVAGNGSEGLVEAEKPEPPTQPSRTRKGLLSQLNG